MTPGNGEIGETGEREGGSDDDFAQSTNLLSPPGHAVGADNESPSLPPSLNIEL